ncbi:MAG: hypothetical protein GVY13_04935 [Alphaproteobacteria bacterium]|jgi:hypothetical protein|nr:hypothetical protein [Alphaproteobacteria bacterium]
MANLQIGSINQFTDFLAAFDFDQLELDLASQFSDLETIDPDDVTMTQTENGLIITAGPFVVEIAGSNFDSMAPLISGLAISRDGTELLAVTITDEQVTVSAGTLDIEVNGSFSQDLGAIFTGDAALIVDNLVLSADGTPLLTATLTADTITAAFDDFVFEIAGTFNTNLLDALSSGEGSIDSITLTNEATGEVLLDLDDLEAPISLVGLQEDPAGEIDAALGELSVSLSGTGSPAALDGLLDTLETDVPSELADLIDAVVPYETILTEIGTQIDEIDNFPPVAVNDTAATTEGQPVTIAVLDNDSDPDADPLDVTAASVPADGTTVVNADNTVTYTPDAGFTGADSFTYSIADGQGGTAEARVDLTVGPEAPEFDRVDIFRFFNTNAGGHFFTASPDERTFAAGLDGFNDEGVGFEALAAGDPQAEAVDVFRFFNTNAGGHFFTTSPDERAFAAGLDGFNDEGVGFRAFAEPIEGTVPVFRFFNSNAGGHFFTTSPDEAAFAASLDGFQDEGIGFYAFPDIA